VAAEASLRSNRSPSPGRHRRAGCSQRLDAPWEQMHVVVDNTAGADAQFADEVVRGLRERGLEVELREPTSAASFDTMVNPVSAGIVIRVPDQPERTALSTIEEVVRAALLQRPSLRRRTRTVPVVRGESRRVIEWIDLFD